MPELVIKTPQLSYPVYVERGIRRRLPGLLASGGNFEGIVVITDRTVAGLYMNEIENLLLQPHHFIVIPEGESSKSLGEYERVMGELLQKKLGRDFLLIAFGGGVVGDLAGYVAATYKRGIAYLQMPTTLLAQIDSSVGGKVGINHPLGKNLIGAIYHPRSVVIDPDFLATLPRREILSGLAEAVKYTFLKPDGYWKQLKTKLPQFLAGNWDGIEEVIAYGLGIKAELVEKDEQDKGERQFLNLGHTFGHALEQATGYFALRHGEAVILGLAAAFRASLLTRRISEADFEAALGLFEILAQEVPAVEMDADRVLKGMEMDKKRKKDALVFVLPVALGTVELVENLDEKIVRQALEFGLHWASELKKVADLERSRKAVR